MGVEVLLVVGGQTHTLEPSASGVALNLLHQSPAVALPSFRLGHDHRLDEQAAAVTYDPGQPGMAEQPLRVPVAPQEDQTDRELRTGLLEGMDPGGLAPLPLRVDQVSAGYQKVRTPVDGNRTDLLGLFRIFLSTTWCRTN